MFTLLIGGARSGKSALAQRIAEQSGLHVTVIATAEPRDEEMKARIRRHRRDRPTSWRTVEAPLDLAAAVIAAPVEDFLVVDCLTLWVSNLIEAGTGEDAICDAAKHVARLLAKLQAVVVTNEVGLGVIPVNELARRFEDVLGRVNASFAESAQHAVLMVAGKALDLTSVEMVLRRS